MDLPRGWDEDLWLAVPGGRSFSVWSDSASGAPVLGGVGVLLQSAGVLVWFVPVLCGWAWGCAAVGGRASGWTLGRSGSGGGWGRLGAALEVEGCVSGPRFRAWGDRAWARI